MFLIQYNLACTGAYYQGPDQEMRPPAAQGPANGTSHPIHAYPARSVPLYCVISYLLLFSVLLCMYCYVFIAKQRYIKSVS